MPQARVLKPRFTKSCWSWLWAAEDISDSGLSNGGSLKVETSMTTTHRKSTKEFRDELYREVISTSKPIRDVAEGYGGGH